MQGRPNNKVCKNFKNEFSHHPEPPTPILRLHFQSFTISFYFAWLLLWLSKLEEETSPSKIKHGRVVNQTHK